ncbi:hypothetical protein SAMN02745866_00039 [Alteromonadaceae bacterium Bs31]|nr:hypothetical protein SAMN02745866_00039 [Alteromonadaceae bacterium Bs31]
MPDLAQTYNQWTRATAFAAAKSFLSENLFLPNTLEESDSTNIQAKVKIAEEEKLREGPVCVVQL